MAKNPYTPFIADRRNTDLPSTPIRMTRPVDVSGPGRALQQLGSALMGIGAKQQAQTDQIQATEAVTAAVQKMDDTWGEYAKLQGKPAYEGFGGARQGIGDIAKQAVDAAPNARQKAAISRSLARSQAIFDGNMKRHQIGQWKKWQDTTSKNAIQEFGKQALNASDPGYEERFDLFMNSARDEALKRGQNLGLDEKTAKTSADAVVGATAIGAMKYQLERGNLEQANKIYERYKGRMDAKTAIAAESLISDKNTDAKVEKMLNERFPQTREGGSDPQPDTGKIQDRLGEDKEIQDRLTSDPNKDTEVKPYDVNPDGTIKPRRELKATGEPVKETLGKPRPTIKTRHDKTIDKVAKETGADAYTLKRFMMIESGGREKAVTGSYKGLFQLSAKEFKKYGRGNIYNAEDNARAAAKKLVVESAEFKQKFGRDPTITDLYMYHQQGKGGTARHYANPGAPAWKNMLATKEGRGKGEKWAKAAIWGNIPTSAKGSPQFNKKQFPKGVNSVTSKQFVEGWGRKLNSQSSIGQTTATAARSPQSLPPIQEALQWANRVSGGNTVLRKKLQSAITDRYRAYGQKKTQYRASVAQTAKNNLAELATEGTASNLLTVENFTAAWGQDAGQTKYDEYVAQSAIARKSHELKDAPLSEHAEIIGSIKPEPGEAAYGQKTKGVAALQLRSRQLQNAANKDPAGYAVSTSEDVRNALDKAVKGTNKDVEDYVRILRAEQTRLKIPPGNWNLIPKPMAEQIAKSITPEAMDGTPENTAKIVASIGSLREKWGNHWPDVLRAVKPEMASKALYVASQDGVSPRVSALLIAHSKDKPGELLKGSEVSSKDLRMELSQKFADYRSTMSTFPADREELAAFYDQGVKLSAIYAAQGQSPSEATEQAYKDLVENRYDIVSSEWSAWRPNTHSLGVWAAGSSTPFGGMTVRIPKQYSGTITESKLNEVYGKVWAEPEELKPWMQQGTEASHLAGAPKGETKDIRPWMAQLDNLGEGARKNVLDNMKSDARFTTLPDDSGVVLMWHDKILHTKDRQPLKFTWEEITEMTTPQPSTEDAAHKEKVETSEAERESFRKQQEMLVH